MWSASTTWPLSKNVHPHQHGTKRKNLANIRSHPVDATLPAHEICEAITFLRRMTSVIITCARMEPVANPLAATAIVVSAGQATKDLIATVTRPATCVPIIIVAMGPPVSLTSTSINAFVLHQNSRVLIAKLK